MIKRNLELIVKGAVIGGTMLIPGVSGGTMAMVVGVYDRLIHAVGDFFQDIRNNFKLLLWFCLGGGVGMLLLAKPLLRLLETFPMPRSEAQKAADKRYAAKTKGKYVQFAVNLLPEEYKRICDVIEAAGMGKTEFLRWAVRELEQRQA